MKWQILFSGKNKKNISKCCLLKTLLRVLRVKVNGYIFMGGNSVKMILSPFWKRIHAKKKEFFPTEDLFLKGLAVQDSKQIITKVILRCWSIVLFRAIPFTSVTLTMKFLIMFKLYLTVFEVVCLIPTRISLICVCTVFICHLSGKKSSYLICLFQNSGFLWSVLNVNCIGMLQ